MAFSAVLLARTPDMIDCEQGACGLDWDAWPAVLPSEQATPGDDAAATGSILETALLEDPDTFLADAATLLDACSDQAQLSGHDGSWVSEAAALGDMFAAGVGSLPGRHGCCSSASSPSLHWLPPRGSSSEPEHHSCPVVADFQPCQPPGHPGDVAPEALPAQLSRGPSMCSTQRSLSQAGEAQKRRGRPRLYDTSLPAPEEPMTIGRHVAEGRSKGKGKAKRGAKPKYLYNTSAEALAMRRERNRSTAINSYYKRKARTEQLEQEIAELQLEQEALRELDGLSQGHPAEAARIGELLTQAASPVELLALLKQPPKP